MPQRLYLGIDLGGTKIAAGLVTEKGKTLHSLVTPTFPEGKANATTTGLADRIAGAAAELMQKQKSGKLVALGIASAGPMNVDEGVLLSPTHFPGWKRVPLVDLVSKALKKRGLKTTVHFQNDAIAAALGEGWVGAAKGLETYAMVTVGTGIGSGVIYRGRPAQFGGMGSEWGLGIISLEEVRRTVDPWLGSTEAFASGTGILRRARALGFEGPSLGPMVQAKDFETKYKPLFADTALALAILCHNLSLGYNPEAILFTGGVMNYKGHFFPEMKETYARLMQKNPLFKTKLKIAKLGNQAGMLGAARLALL